MTTIGAFASIFDDAGRILLVRQAYARRLWTTPGGRVEDGESPITALKREVLEETGCEVEPTQFLGVYAKPYRNDLVLSFAARVRSGKPDVANSEVSKLGFFHCDALPAEMAPNSRTRVIDAFGARRFVMRVFENERSTGTLLSHMRLDRSFNSDAPPARHRRRSGSPLKLC